MPILYNSEKRIFTLNTKSSTYQFQADSYGYLIHFYYGRKTDGLMDWTIYLNEHGFSCNPYEAKNNREYSLEYLPQEFPFQGNGDFKSPLFIVRDKDGVYDCDLKYKDYEIIKGKYSLSGLPAVYSENDNDNAETLKIFLEDKRLNIQVTLLYGVLPEIDIITRSAIIKNNSNEIITIEKFQTSCLDFTHGDFDAITFYGRHTMERQFNRHELHHGSYIIESRRGMSSHQYNPFVILAEHSTNEMYGRCWGMQFVYSGGFKAEFELDQYNQTRFQIGLSDEKFSYPLKSSEELVAPEVILSFSNEGLNKLSKNFHKCIKNNICRGFWKNKLRPVILNSWEALYFDFNGSDIIKIAEQARNLGVDMLVLDDGWFINRSDDNRALGDWIPDEEKLGSSLKNLINKINEIGLKFGIWIEPEMISENSNLFKKYSDWAFIIPKKDPVLGRNQLVLDFSRKEVRDYIFNCICSLLDYGNIEYIKWDYNRAISDVFSYTTDNQGKVLYDYILGLYELLEKIIKRYPTLLIEGCAGGGGRFDAGMLYYTPQIWCSDNTDALDRLYIHYGTSFGYPQCVISAHVSSCPNHQTGRITPLKTRGIVSMTGAFGYELNINKLSESEKAEIKEQIKVYKENQEIITNGNYYRLSNPYNEKFFAWEYVSYDEKEVILNAVIQERHGNMPIYYVTLQKLTSGAFYKEIKSGKIYAANALMDYGFPLPQQLEDYQSYSYRFEKL